MIKLRVEWDSSTRRVKQVEQRQTAALQDHVAELEDGE